MKINTPRLKPLYELSITCTGEAEEPLAVLLERVAGVTANIYSDVQKNVSRCRAYIDKSLTDAQRASLSSGLRDLQELRLLKRLPAIREKKIVREDWAESWKKHFKPLRIGGKLLVKPSWSKTLPRRTETVVILDPGLSFGTGNHPTTEFCLEVLAKQRTAAPQSFLDAGCGSGILAIAAAKLGYKPVKAFDFDPEAVRIARENAKVNKAKIQISRKDLTRIAFPKQYDVVCANLIDDLLINFAPLLASAVKPGGTLVLAGILTPQYSAVRKAFSQIGFRQISIKTKKEWRSGAFRAPKAESGKKPIKFLN